MDFKTMFSILKNRLSDGDDVPSFFRELMAMITSVSEAEWGTKKDPSSRVKDDTLRSYSKRGLTKAFAKSIVYRLTPERLTSMIQKRPPALRQALAEDLQPYDDSTNKDNVGKIVADLFVEIIRTAAGIVPADELVIIKQQETAVELKHKYGELLRNEAGDCCPFPGCGRALFITNGDKAIPSYEVCIIDKGKGDSITNLIALCPNCYHFETPDDTGTGSNYKGLVIYDLAILALTALPAIAHDSLILKNISDESIDGIMRIYEASEKQVFIAFDKQAAYKDDTRRILLAHTVLKLSDGNCELYGESWNKENAQ